LKNIYNSMYKGGSSASVPPPPPFIRNILYMSNYTLPLILRIRQLPGALPLNPHHSFTMDPQGASRSTDPDPPAYYRTLPFYEIPGSTTGKSKTPNMNGL
jgi:hypothetical protein